MPIAPADRALLLTQLLGSLRTLEAARGLSLATRVAMDHVLLDALADPAFGGVVTASPITHVTASLPDGSEDHDAVRLLTVDASKHLPYTPSDLDPSIDAALLVATLALDDAPVYVESANIHALASEILDAAFSGAEGDAALWLDSLRVLGVPMTRCVATLTTFEDFDAASSTAHAAYLRRAPGASARAAVVLRRLASLEVPWVRVVREVFARIPTLRTPSRGAAHLVLRGGLRAVSLARLVPPSAALEQLRQSLPALDVREIRAAMRAPRLDRLTEHPGPERLLGNLQQQARDQLNRRLRRRPK